MLSTCLAIFTQAQLLQYENGLSFRVRLHLKAVVKEFVQVYVIKFEFLRSLSTGSCALITRALLLYQVRQASTQHYWGRANIACVIIIAVSKFTSANESSSSAFRAFPRCSEICLNNRINYSFVSASSKPIYGSRRAQHNDFYFFGPEECSVFRILFDRFSLWSIWNSRLI